MYLAYLLFLSKISLSFAQQWYEASTEEVTISQQEDSIEPFSARSDIECTLKCQLALKGLPIKSVFVVDKDQCYCISNTENTIHTRDDFGEEMPTLYQPHQVFMDQINTDE